MQPGASADYKTTDVGQAVDTNPIASDQLISSNSEITYNEIKREEPDNSNGDKIIIVSCVVILIIVAVFIVSQL